MVIRMNGYMEDMTVIHHLYNLMLDFMFKDYDFIIN